MYKYLSFTFKGGIHEFYCHFITCMVG